MKHERRPTLQQKILISNHGLNPLNWHVIKNYPTHVDGQAVFILEIVHRYALKPRKITYLLN